PDRLSVSSATPDYISVMSPITGIRRHASSDYKLIAAAVGRRSNLCPEGILCKTTVNPAFTIHVFFSPLSSASAALCWLGSAWLHPLRNRNPTRRRPSVRPDLSSACRTTMGYRPPFVIYPKDR